MPTTTTNLGLTKPDSADKALIAVLNNNADLLDATFAAGTPSNQAIGDVAAGGSLLQAARIDHKHGMPGFGAVSNLDDTPSNGASANISRSDHKHGLAAGITLPNGKIADYVDVEEQTVDQAAPAAGYQRVYAKNDGALYLRQSGGTIVALTPDVTPDYTDYTHQGSDPAAPAAGFLRLYAKADNGLYTRKSSGGIRLVHHEAYIEREEQGSDAAAPGVGTARLYVKTDGGLYLRRNTGDVRLVDLAAYAEQAEQGSDPAAPASGYLRTWAGDDGRLYRRRATGSVRPVLLELERPVVLNGGFDVWQRGATFTSIADGAYGPDRWKYNKVGTMVHDLLRSTSVPTAAADVPVQNFSLHLDVTTADGAIAAGDVCYLSQRIEGYRWIALAQREHTIGFWVMDSKTGVHCVALRNSGQDRSYVAEYTINAADTWEYKTITVPASPAAGTWNFDNGIGVELCFVLACGSTFQTTAGSWQTGNFLGTANQVNAVDNVLNNFRLAMVQLDLGAAAAPFRVVPFAEMLALCQRYYCKTFPYATAPAQNSGVTGGVLNYRANFNSTPINSNWPWTFPAVMRGAPTITTYNPSAANSSWRNLSDATDSGAATVVYASEQQASINNPQAATDEAGDELAIHAAASAEL